MRVKLCLHCSSCYSATTVSAEVEPCPTYEGAVHLETDKNVQAWFNSHHQPTVEVHG